VRCKNRDTGAVGAGAVQAQILGLIVMIYSFNCLFVVRLSRVTYLCALFTLSV